MLLIFLSVGVARFEHVSASVVSATGAYVPTVLDADDRPDDVTAWAATVAPGGDVLAPLAAVDVTRLSDAGRIDALAALDRQRAFVEAQQVRVIQAMTAAADRSACPLDKDFF
jgi:hypothetical protein